MRTTDRFLVVTSLGIALTSLALHVGRGPSAIAAPNALPANDLGPADAVALVDAKPVSADAATVRVRAEGGRVTWDDRATSKAWSIGAVHVDKAMKALLNASTYADKRKELEDAAKKQEEAFAARGEELRKKYANVGPQSPEAPQAQAESQALYQEYEQWRQGSMKIQEKLFAEQVEAAYRELVNAVETVCEKEKIDIVVRFSPTANPFETDTLGGAREQVISRTFLTYPETIDITDEVLKSLNITGG